MNTNPESEETKLLEESSNLARFLANAMQEKEREEGRRFPAAVWTSAITSLSLQVLIQCGVSYEYFCLEQERIKKIYKEWLEEYENSKTQT